MYALKTLSDLKQSLADRHDNGTVPTNSTILAKYVRLLNRGVEYCADKLRITRPVTLTVASGVADLPDDFITIKSLFDSDNNEYVRVDPTDTNLQTGYAYWITGNQTSGFVLNSENDGTFTANISYRPTWMSSDSDVCLIPDIEAPVSYAYAMLRKSESDPFEDSEGSLQECDARIAEMMSSYNINTDVLHFEIY